MKSSYRKQNRVELGRVSTATLGNAFRTIEQVGLQGVTAGITDL